MTRKRVDRKPPPGEEWEWVVVVGLPRLLQRQRHLLFVLPLAEEQEEAVTTATEMHKYSTPPCEEAEAVECFHENNSTEEASPPTEEPPQPKPAYSSSYAITLVLFSALLLLILFVSSSKRTLSRCFRARRHGDAALRRDSTLIAIVEEDLLRQMHGLIMMPRYNKEAGRITAFHPRETTVSFVSALGGVRESTLRFSVSADGGGEDEDCSSSEEGEETSSFYGAAKAVLKRQREDKKKVAPAAIVVPPATTIQVTARRDSSSGIQVTVTPPTPSGAAKKDSDRFSFPPIANTAASSSPRRSSPRTKTRGKKGNKKAMKKSNKSDLAVSTPKERARY